MRFILVIMTILVLSLLVVGCGHPDIKGDDGTGFAAKDKPGDDPGTDNEVFDEIDDTLVDENDDIELEELI